jgi:hypothetical protein
MLTLSFNSSAFRLAPATIISAPARFSWMRSRVTSSDGFSSPVGAGRTERHRARAAANLINVDVGAVAVNIGDITLNDLVDVQDVLNTNRIRILNNVLNNSPILSNNSDFLNNLFRDANLITDNQVVVGVLSGPTFVIETLP